MLDVACCLVSAICIHLSGLGCVLSLVGQIILDFVVGGLKSVDCVGVM